MGFKPFIQIRAILLVVTGGWQAEPEASEDSEEGHGRFLGVTVLWKSCL